MPYASFELTGNPLIPSIVHLGDRSTPVWLQNRWENGPYTRYVRANGCGHCCTAMALCLCGHSVTPYEEYLRCRDIFGVPDEVRTFHWLTMAGIAASLQSYGVRGEAFGHGGGEAGIGAALAHIRASLAEGHLVIFCSAPLRKDNPFSTGLHYVLLTGLDGDGNAIVANSSLKARPSTVGVQIVPLTAVGEAMRPEGCTLQSDLTWGLIGHYPTGYVVVE